MKRISLYLFIVLLLGNCLEARSQQADRLYHYSVIEAMRNGVYHGSITLDKLSKQGDFGLGTFHLLDGEMIVSNGVFYRVAPDGKVLKAKKELLSPFAALTFFKPDKEISLNHVSNDAALFQEIRKNLPSENKVYAIRIECRFDSVVTGGSEKVEPDNFTGLATLMKTRPVYHRKQVSGTLVGFYYPAYLGGVDLSPFHFHFISSDNSFGGHFIGGTLSDVPVKVWLDEKNDLDISLPPTDKGYVRKWDSAPAKSSY